MADELAVDPGGPIAALFVAEGIVLANQFDLEPGGVAAESALSALIGLAAVVASRRMRSQPGCIVLLLFDVSQMSLWLGIALAARVGGGPEPFFVRGLDPMSRPLKIVLVLIVAQFWALLMCIPTGLVIAKLVDDCRQMPNAAAKPVARLAAKLAPWCFAGVVCAVAAAFDRSRAGAWMATLGTLTCLGSTLVTAWALWRVRRGEPRVVTDQLVESVQADGYRAPARRVIERTRIETLPPDEQTAIFVKRLLVRTTRMFVVAVLAAAFRALIA